MTAGDPESTRRHVERTLNGAHQSPLTQLVGRVGRGSVGVLAFNLFGFAALLVVSRALGPGPYGRYGLALTLSVYTMQLMHWGVHPLLTRELVRASPAESRRQLAGLVRMRQVSTVVLLLAAAGLAAAWSPGERALVLLGVADGIVLGWIIPSAFDARGRTATWMLLASLRPATYLVAAVLLVALWPGGMRPDTFILLHATLPIPWIAYEWFWVRRQYGPLDWSGAGTRARTLWWSATPVALGDTAVQVLSYLGVPIMEWGDRGSELGPLMVSNQLAVAACAFAVVPEKVLQAHLSAFRDVHGPDFRRRLVRLLAIALGAGVVISAVLSLSARWIIPLLFGADYSPAIALFTIDAWRFAAVLVGVVLGSALIARGQARHHGAAQVVSVVVALVIAVAAVPSHGAPAAAVAVLAGRVSYAVFAALALVKRG